MRENDAMQDNAAMRENAAMSESPAVSVPSSGSRADRSVKGGSAGGSDSFYSAHESRNGAGAESRESRSGAGLPGAASSAASWVDGENGISENGISENIFEDGVLVSPPVEAVGGDEDGEWGKSEAEKSEEAAGERKV